MKDYTPPKSIKLIEGKFAYDETVTLEVDGKLVKRKVHYGTLNGAVCSCQRRKDWIWKL